MRSSVAGMVVIALSAGCNTASTPTSPSLVARSAETTAGGGADTLSATSTAVPLKGKLEGNAEPFPPVITPTTTFLDVHVHAVGNATHLGRFTMDYSHRVILMDLKGTGAAIFTAANGDTLKTTVEGEARPSDSPNVFTVAETHTITGGTGRFADAGGSFVVTRTVDFADPLTAGSIDGHLIKH